MYDVLWVNGAENGDALPIAATLCRDSGPLDMSARSFDVRCAHAVEVSIR